MSQFLYNFFRSRVHFLCIAAPTRKMHRSTCFEFFFTFSPHFLVVHTRWTRPTTTTVDSLKQSWEISLVSGWSNEMHQHDVVVDFFLLSPSTLARPPHCRSRLIKKVYCIHASFFQNDFHYILIKSIFSRSFESFVRKNAEKKFQNILTISFTRSLPITLDTTLFLEYLTRLFPLKTVDEEEREKNCKFKYQI